MQQLAIDAIEHATDGRGRERRGLTAGLGATDLSVNHYRVDPGERVSGLHAHGDQEEVFLVLEGELTFEVYLPGDDEAAGGREVAVAASEAVRFAPGEYQSARNAGDAPATCFALGAPPGTEEVRVPLACPDCGHDHVAPTLSADREPVLECPDCGNQSTVECPDCGSDAMHAVLGGDGEPVSACRDCGHESATL